MKRTAYLGWSLLLMAVMAIPTVLQAQDEGTAYATYYAESDCAKRADLGEKFVMTFTKSQYADPAYRGTLNCYYKLNNFQKVMDLAGKLDQMIPDMKPSDKVAVYEEAMDSAQRANNNHQAVVFGEKAISVDPNDLNAMIVLASIIPYDTPQDKAAIGKAEGYAQKGLTTLAAMKAPEGISADEWTKQKTGIEGTLHSTLGGIYFNKQDFDKAGDELVAATKCAPTDPSNWYNLGMAYNYQYVGQVKPYEDAVAKANAALKTKDQAMIEESKAVASALEQAVRDKRDQAIDALATAVSLGGATREQAMTQLKKLYTTKNNGSTDGLEQLINSKKPAQ
jgi:tetratricopeptide (TPR) repeat protein